MTLWLYIARRFLGALVAVFVGVLALAVLFDALELLRRSGGSGDVGFGDLVQVLSAWGPCPGCPQDLDNNGVVGFSDVVMLLAAWGLCP